MNNSNLFTVVCWLTILLHPAIASSQQEQNVQQRFTPSEKVAEGQTKIMVKQLNIKATRFQEVYKINLKYQLQIDSLRMTNTEVKDRKQIYLLISQKKNEELRKVLTDDQYDKYQKILEERKTKALEIREKK